MASPGVGTIKVLPEGFNALLAPAAMLPAWLPRPPFPAPVVVLVAVELLLGTPTPAPRTPAAWDIGIEVAATIPATSVVMINFRIVISRFACTGSTSAPASRSAIAERLKTA